MVPMRFFNCVGVQDSQPWCRTTPIIPLLFKHGGVLPIDALYVRGCQEGVEIQIRQVNREPDVNDLFKHNEVK